MEVSYDSYKCPWNSDGIRFDDDAKVGFYRNKFGYVELFCYQDEMCLDIFFDGSKHLKRFSGCGPLKTDMSLKLLCRAFQKEVQGNAGK